MRSKTCQGFKSMILNRNFSFHTRLSSQRTAPPAPPEHATASTVNVTTNVTTVTFLESKYRQTGGYITVHSRALFLETKKFRYWNPVTCYRSAHLIPLHPDFGTASFFPFMCVCQHQKTAISNWQFFSNQRAVREKVNRPEGRVQGELQDRWGAALLPSGPLAARFTKISKNTQGLYCYPLALSPLYIAEISPPLFPGHFNLFYMLSLKDC